MLPDERKRSIITDRPNWFNGLAKDASEHEDQRNDEGTNAYSVGRRTDENVYGSIVDQMLQRLESISSTIGIRKFRGKTSYRTCGWVLSRKIGGSEDINTDESCPRSIMECPFTASFNPPRYFHSQLPLPYRSLVMCTRELG